MGERRLDLIFQTPGTNVDSLLLTSDPQFDPVSNGNPPCDWEEAGRLRESEAYFALSPFDRQLVDAGRLAFNGVSFSVISTVRTSATSNQSRIRGEVASSQFHATSTQAEGPPILASSPTVVLRPLAAVAEDAFAGPSYGASVAVAGGTVMVAAAGVAPASGPEGRSLEPAGRSSVYVYERQADGSWLLGQRLVPPCEWGRDPHVWTSVVLDVVTAVVVADSGFAFVYRREGGAWGLTARLAAEEPGKLFSGRVALEGGRIALTSRIERICQLDPSCFPNSVYLFRWWDGDPEPEPAFVMRVTAASASGTSWRVVLASVTWPLPSRERPHHPRKGVVTATAPSSGASRT